MKIFAAKLLYLCSSSRMSPLVEREIYENSETENSFRWERKCLCGDVFVFRLPTHSYRFTCLMSLKHLRRRQRGKSQWMKLEASSFVSGLKGDAKAKTWWTFTKKTEKRKIISIMMVIAVTVVWARIKIYGRLSEEARSGAGWKCLWRFFSMSLRVGKHSPTSRLGKLPTQLRVPWQSPQRFEEIIFYGSNAIQVTSRRKTMSAARWLVNRNGLFKLFKARNLRNTPAIILIIYCPESSSRERKLLMHFYDVDGKA